MAAKHQETMIQLFAALAENDPVKMNAIFPATPRHIGMVAYAGMFPLDFIGPQQVWAGLMQTQIHVIAASKKPIEFNGLSLKPTHTYRDTLPPLDVLFVPGGLEGTAQVIQDRAALAFLQKHAERSRWITSVCTGSLILGAAGLLKGKKACTYWSARSLLAEVGAVPTVARYVEDGNVITGAGVTAGMDMALLVAAKLAGDNYAQALQLYLEYDPQPPFHAGSPESAPPLITEAMQSMYGGGVDLLRAALKG
jgi:cyclohexyl-isocyanide hydratase